MATKDLNKKDDADFAAGFNAEDKANTGPTDDEEFGLTDAANGGDADGGTATGGGGTAADGGGDASGAVAAGGTETGAAGPDPKELEAEAARLRDLDAALKAKAEELAAKEAAMSTSNTNEQQTSSGGGDGDDKAAGGGDGGDGGEDDDPEKALEEDFGPEFVSLLKRLFKKWAGKEFADGLGPLETKINDVIEHLQSERTASHFKAIAAAHADYEEIVSSPEFGTWKAQQSPDEQKRLERVIQSGTSDEIIAMLTSFKDSRQSSVDEDAIDQAEGVRSSGLSLPKAPPASDDFVAAWNSH